MRGEQQAVPKKIGRLRATTIAYGQLLPERYAWVVVCFRPLLWPCFLKHCHLPLSDPLSKHRQPHHTNSYAASSSHRMTRRLVNLATCHKLNHVPATANAAENRIHPYQVPRGITPRTADNTTPQRRSPPPRLRHSLTRGPQNHAKYRRHHHAAAVPVTTKTHAT